LSHLVEKRKEEKEKEKKERKRKKRKKNKRKREKRRKGKKKKKEVSRRPIPRPSLNFQPKTATGLRRPRTGVVVIANFPRSVRVDGAVLCTQTEPI
jgi:hypothetical protein